MRAAFGCALFIQRRSADLDELLRIQLPDPFKHRTVPSAMLGLVQAFIRTLPEWNAHYDRRRP